MPHRGEILEKVVGKKFPNKAQLAREIGYDRSTIYRHFTDPDLEDGILLKYAKVLKYDFSRELPELTDYSNMLQEPLEAYRPMTLSDALKEIDQWKSKYINLLEKHNDLLKVMLNDK